MANRADASVVFSTKFDNKGLLLGIRNAAREVDKLTREFDKTTASIRAQETAIADMQRKYEALTKGEKTPASLRAMQSALRDIEREIKSIETANKTLFADYDAAVARAEEFRSLGGVIFKQAVEEAAELAERLNPAWQQLDELGAKAHELRTSMESVKLDPQTSAEAKLLADKIADANAKLEQSRQNALALQERIMKLAQAGLDKPAEDMKKLSDSTEHAKSSAKGLLEHLNGLTKPVKSLLKHIISLVAGMKLFRRETNKSGNAVTDFGRRIRKLVAAALVFNVIRRGLTKLRDYIGGLLKTNADFVASLNAIKVNLQIAFYPIYQAVLPALNALMPALATAATYIAHFTSMLFGKTYAESKAGAKALNEQADALKAVGGAAGKAAKNMAAFDEINQLRNNSSGGGGGIDAADISALEQLRDKLLDIVPDLEYFENLGVTIGQKITDGLAKIPWDKIQATVSSISQKLAAFLNGMVVGLDWRVIGNTIAQALNTALIFAHDFLTTFRWVEFGQALATGINSVFENFNWTLLGATMAAWVMAFFDTLYGLFTTLDWEKIGTAIGDTINSFFENLNWKRMGETVSAGIKGALSALRTAIVTADWKAIGEDIREFLINIDWAGIWEEVKAVIRAAFSGFHDFLTGLFGSEKKAKTVETLAAAIGAVVGAIVALNKVSRASKAIKEIAGLFGVGKTLGKGAEATAAISTAAGGLSTKLTALAKNLGMGLVIIAEVAAAAILITGAIWVLGKELEQVGLAWQPVIDNGETIAAAMGIGVGILAAIGTVTAALGSVGAGLAVNIAIGTGILAEIGIAAGLFILEIWAVGKGLDEIGKAWQPVLDNGETIANAISIGTGILVGVGVAAAALGAATVASAGLLPLAIGLGTVILLELGVAAGLFITEIWAIGKALDEIGKAWQPVLDNGDAIENAIVTGTGLLIGVGTAAAALGVASIASVGLLPLAIGLGTAILVELSDAFVVFADSLVVVANELSNNLHPALRKLNEKLPELSSDMSDFVEFMKEFAGHVVTYAASNTIAGIAATVDTIIGWFTKDPVKKLAEDVKKMYEHMTTLNEKLSLAIPEMQKANDMLSEYSKLLGGIEELTKEHSALTLSNDIFVNMKDFGKNLVTGLHEGVSSKASLFKDVGNQFTDWWEDVKKWWKLNPVSGVTEEAGKNLVKGIIKGVESLIDNVGVPFQTSLDTIKEQWGSFPGWFISNVSSPLQEAVTTLMDNIASSISSAIPGIVGSYKELYNAILSKTESFANNFQDAHYKMVKATSGMLSKLPNAQKIYVYQPSKISIPRLAKGGIVDSATIAMIGEKGREAVVPLSKNAEWMEPLNKMRQELEVTNSLVRQVIDAINESAGRPIIMDGKVVTDTVVNRLRSQQRSTGKAGLLI